MLTSRISYELHVCSSLTMRDSYLYKYIPAYLQIWTTGISQPGLKLLVQKPANSILYCILTGLYIHAK